MASEQIPTTNPPNGQWVERFRQQFKHSQFVNYSAIEQFIAQELQAHAKEQVEAALKPILDAWTIKGSHPHYHDEVKQRVSQMWPSLFRAVENAINTLNEMSRDKDANK